MLTSIKLNIWKRWLTRPKDKFTRNERKQIVKRLYAEHEEAMQKKIFIGRPTK